MTKCLWRGWPETPSVGLMKRRLILAVALLVVFAISPLAASTFAVTTLTGVTRTCSTATSYSIRSTASASGTLVKTVGMNVTLTVAGTTTSGGAWGPSSCAVPTSGSTWYQVFAVGSTAVSGYIYSGAVQLSAPVPTPVTATFTRPAAGTLHAPGGTTVSQPSATGNITWTETGIVTSRAITEFYGTAVAGTCNGVTWTAVWTSTTAASPFAISGFSLGRCYRFTIVLNGNPAKSASSGNLLITSATYARNLYGGTLVRYQDPDYTACTATSTMMMLNFTATKGTKGTGFRWGTTISYTAQESILAWGRAHDTLVSTGRGSDPNGWRNALNFYGWNDYTNSATMTYKVFAYSSYDAAVKAAVTAMAKYNKPVGLLAWAGGHAQVLNGYQISGLNPATSSNFTVQYVYITDPLQKDALRNAQISNANFKAGSLTYRFRAYAYTDSPYDDPYTAGTVAAYQAWYGKWVIAAPVR